jgi:hypothetical protein
MLHVVRKRMGRAWTRRRRRAPSAPALALATLLATFALVVPGRRFGAATRRGRRARRRTVLYLAAALVLPGQALALNGTPLPFVSTAPAERSAAPTELAVWATLYSCDGTAPEISCTIGVSYTEIPEAASYTLALIGPEGSTLHQGGVAGGAATVTVPYVGDGTYLARVSAYGAPANGRSEGGSTATHARRGPLIETAIATSDRPSGDEESGDDEEAQGGQRPPEAGADPGSLAPSGGSLEADPGAAPGASQSPAEPAPAGDPPAGDQPAEQPGAEQPPAEQPPPTECPAAEEPLADQASTEGVEDQAPAEGAEAPADGAPPAADSSSSGDPTTPGDPLDATPEDCPQA